MVGDFLKEERDRRAALRESAQRVPRNNTYDPADLLWLLDLLNEKDNEIERLYEDLAGEDL